MLLWLTLFFTLPSWDIPGQGGLHSGLACCTSGGNCRLENLATYFAATVNCGSGLNSIRGALSGFPFLFYNFPPPHSEFAHSFFCLWSFKKLDCSSVIKITHTSDLQIATSQEERHFRGRKGRGGNHAMSGECRFSLISLPCPKTQWIEGNNAVWTGEFKIFMDWTRSLNLSSSSAHHPLFFHPYPWGSCPIFWVKKNERIPQLPLSVIAKTIYSVCRVLPVSPYFFS